MSTLPDQERRKSVSDEIKAILSGTYTTCLRADLHSTIFVACDNGLRQAHDMIYDCCVRQKNVVAF